LSHTCFGFKDHDFFFRLPLPIHTTTIVQFQDSDLSVGEVASSTRQPLPKKITPPPNSRNAGSNTGIITGSMKPVQPAARPTRGPVRNTDMSKVKKKGVR